MRGAYLLVLVVCLLATLPLEVALKTGVYRRWRRLLLSLAPVVPLFVGWDVVAVARGQWSFDPRYVLGVRLPGSLPLEEVLFFLVVPTCAIMTLEAVRRTRHGKPGWAIGDEPPAAGPGLGSPAPDRSAAVEPPVAEPTDQPGDRR